MKRKKCYKKTDLIFYFVLGLMVATIVIGIIEGGF